jgi:hypothetical protein
MDVQVNNQRVLYIQVCASSSRDELAFKQFPVSIDAMHVSFFSFLIAWWWSPFVIDSILLAYNLSEMYFLFGGYFDKGRKRQQSECIDTGSIWIDAEE